MAGISSAHPIIAACKCFHVEEAGTRRNGDHNVLFHKPEAKATARASDGADERTAGGLSTPGVPWRQGFPIHPIFIAAFPILSLYAHNLDDVLPNEVWRPLGLALIGSIVVWALIVLLTRHIRKAAFAASAIVLFFFSYGHVSNLLPEGLRGATTPLCIVGLSILLLIISRSRGTLSAATSVVNLASIMLIVPSCLTIGARLPAMITHSEKLSAARAGLTYKRNSTTQGDEAQTPVDRQPAPARVAGSAQLPDIYYIILDAYGRADSLKTFYGYDNTPFIRALEQRGFYVAHHSRANYPLTSYCLPTSLNMRYLQDLLREQEPPIDTRRMIDENAVAAYLHGLGYHYVNIWTGTGATRVETADLELDNDSLTPPSSFEGQVFSLSVLDAAPQTQPIALGIAGAYDRHRAFILSAFHNLNSVAKLPYPKFVFAHILAPHPPFVFDSDGRPVYPPYPYNEADGSKLLEMHKITRSQYRTGYISQLRYINGRVLQAIDAIIRQSSRPPVIIVQGDHGSRMNMDWSSERKTDLREPFSILNAYYVPARVRLHLYDSITPVNSFRIVLTNLFGANYPPLPDRSFFFAPGQPLHFSEVTNLIPQFAEDASTAPMAPPVRGKTR
jgi:Sulfatase